MRSLLITFLHSLTRRILGRYRPMVIGITGSVGKTSVREALFHILASRGRRVGQSPRSFNTDIGVPLAVFGLSSSPRRSPVGWVRALLFGLRLAYGAPRQYPEALVLELGANRPGDIASLMSLVAPVSVGILTAIAPTHLEGFMTVEAIAVEKKKLLTALPFGATAIYPGDERRYANLKRELSAKTMTVGLSPECDLRVFEVRSSLAPSSGEPPGTFFKLAWKGSVVPCFVPGILGTAAARSAAFAAAGALALGENPLDISTALRQWAPPPGRMRVLPGIKHAMLIDDSYNSSPKALEAALETLFTLEFPGSEEGLLHRRIVVLGDMAELGAESEAAHVAVGARVAQLKPDIFLAVGPRMAQARRAAVDHGYPEATAYHFPEATGAARFLQDRIQPHDVILIKGSQIMRMERAVKELMAEPLRVAELLVRQGQDWQQR